MGESKNLDVNSVLNGLNLETKNGEAGTKYINKVENLSLKGKNLNITVTTRRSLGDYICDLLFFILRCLVVILILIYLISIFGLNVARSSWGVSGNIKNNIVNSVGGSLDSIPFLGQTNVVNDYVGLMDELLEN